MALTRETAPPPYFDQHYQGDECPVENFGYMNEIWCELKAMGIHIPEFVDLRRALVIRQAKGVLKGKLDPRKGREIEVVDPNKLEQGTVIQMVEEVRGVERYFKDRSLQDFFTAERNLAWPDSQDTPRYHNLHRGVISRVGNGNVLISFYKLLLQNGYYENKTVVSDQPITVGAWRHDSARIEHQLNINFTGVHRIDWFSRVNEARAF